MSAARLLLPLKQVLDCTEDDFDLLALVRLILSRDEQVLRVLYDSVWLRPLCSLHTFSDTLMTRLIEFGRQRMSFQEFSTLWTAERPQDVAGIHDQSKAVCRDVFKAIKVYEDTHAPKSPIPAEQPEMKTVRAVMNGEAKESEREEKEEKEEKDWEGTSKDHEKDDDLGDNEAEQKLDTPSAREISSRRGRFVRRTSVLDAFKNRVEIRALVSSDDWLAAAFDLPVLTELVEGAPSYMDYDGFVNLLKSSVALKDHLEQAPTTMDPALLLVLLQKDAEKAAKWPIKPYGQVSHVQIEELAKVWGVDPKAEPHLLWVVRRALEAVLPAEWQFEGNQDDSKPVFWNAITEERVYEHPATDYFQSLVEHERQQLEQEKSLLFPQQPQHGQGHGAKATPVSLSTHAWMSFTFVLKKKKDAFEAQKQSESEIDKKGTANLKGRKANLDEVGKLESHHVHYFYNFATGVARGFAPAEDEGFVIHDVNASFSSKVQKAFPVRQFLEQDGFETSATKLREKAASKAKVAVKDITTLNFRSWWTEFSGPGTVKEGSVKRFVEIFFHLKTGHVQVIIQGTDKIFTFSHLRGRHGPLESWDLYVGATINILGRPTTLKQPSMHTLQWIRHHENRLKKLHSQLKDEISKYNPYSKILKQRVLRRETSPSAGIQLRQLINEVSQLHTELSEYRPRLADRLCQPLSKIVF